VELRNPYLILGLPYGSARENAAPAYARAMRRVRRAPDNSPYRLEDLGWALHELEHNTDDPASDLRYLRVPAVPEAYALEGADEVPTPRPRAKLPTPAPVQETQVAPEAPLLTGVIATLAQSVDQLLPEVAVPPAPTVPPLGPPPEPEPVEVVAPSSATRPPRGTLAAASEGVAPPLTVGVPDEGEAVPGSTVTDAARGEPPSSSPAPAPAAAVAETPPSWPAADAGMVWSPIPGRAWSGRAALNEPDSDASLGSRIAARLIDLWLVSFFVAMAFQGRSTYLAVALPFLTGYVYFVAFEATTGRTLGKRLVGIEATGITGPLDIEGALRRNAFLLAGLVPAVGPFAAIAAGLAAIYTASQPGQRGYHDTFAGSYVRRIR
jgi:hypothetical protein